MKYAYCYHIFGTGTVEDLPQPCRELQTNKTKKDAIDSKVTMCTAEPCKDFLQCSKYEYYPDHIPDASAEYPYPVTDPDAPPAPPEGYPTHIGHGNCRMSDDTAGKVGIDFFWKGKHKDAEGCYNQCANTKGCKAFDWGPWCKVYLNLPAWGSSIKGKSFCYKMPAAEETQDEEKKEREEESSPPPPPSCKQCKDTMIRRNWAPKDKTCAQWASTIKAKGYCKKTWWKRAGFCEATCDSLGAGFSDTRCC